MFKRHRSVLHHLINPLSVEFSGSAPHHLSRSRLITSAMSGLFMSLIMNAACQPHSQPRSRARADDVDPVMSVEDHAEQSSRNRRQGQPLTAREIFTRASLDLRGTRPSVIELEAISNDPDQLEIRLDELVEGPQFLDRVKTMFAPAFRTLIDTYDLEGDERLDELSGAIGEEPLNLIAYLVEHDLPYTELVTASYTVVDPRLLDLWPLSALDESPEASGALTVATYHDGRPMSGVLSMNAMWWRHTSTLENANRGRANALSQALLCQSWLDRPVNFPTDVDLTDTESMNHAIKTNPACTACHATLDPLASYLWGFMNELEDADSRTRYQLRQELRWQQTTQAAPAYFGQRGHSLYDLGHQIAADPRFVTCAVRRVYEALLGRRATLDDEGALIPHREAFISSGLNLKRLVRSMINDPLYRNHDAQITYGGRARPVTLKLLGASLLASDLESLTGYTPSVNQRSLLSLDTGLRALAGGSDRGEAYIPSTSLLLTHFRLAEGAAWRLVHEDEIHDVGGLIGQQLSEVDLSSPPTRDLIEKLWILATSREVDIESREIDQLMSLVELIRSETHEPSQVWTGLLTAILADPSRLMY